MNIYISFFIWNTTTLDKEDIRDETESILISDYILKLVSLIFKKQHTDTILMYR